MICLNNSTRQTAIDFLETAAAKDLFSEINFPENPRELEGMITDNDEFYIMLVDADDKWEIFIKEKLQTFKSLGMIILYDLELPHKKDDPKTVCRMIDPLLQDNLKSVIELLKTVLSQEKTITRDILLRKEIHHRIKNNFQLVVSLIRLQKDRLNEEHIASILTDTEYRVRTMANLYQNIYETDAVHSIALKNFLTGFIESIITAGTFHHGSIRKDIYCEDIPVSLDVAIPLAMLLNEIITNSIKHAFRDIDVGIIRLNLRKEDDHITIIIGDNGPGIPSDIDVSVNGSLGLELIYSLTGQLRGIIKLLEEEGTVYAIEIPLKKGQ